MKVKIVVFDWSGVISDDAEPVYWANMKILNEFGKPKMSFEEWKGRTTLSPREFLKNHGIDEDPEKLFELYARYFSEAPVRPKVFPDVKETFSYLKSKNKNIVVISSHPEQNLRNEISEYGLDDYISSIYGSIKDKTYALIILSETLKIPISEILYVGDTIWDVMAAKKAGIHSAAVLTGYHSKEMLTEQTPELIINKLNDLKKYIR